MMDLICSTHELDLAVTLWTWSSRLPPELKHATNNTATATHSLRQRLEKLRKHVQIRDRVRDAVQSVSESGQVSECERQVAQGLE